MNTISVSLLSGALIIWSSGCAHQQPESAGTFAPQAGLSPTSNRSSQRVYTTTITAPGGAQASITEGSRTPGNGGNQDIAETVRQMILADPKLAPYPSRVTATMDPDAEGRVILTGWVPTPGVKKNLVKQVKAVAEAVDRRVAPPVATPTR